MKDNDLDRLLSDIDSRSDYSASREESLRTSQRMARRGDTNIGFILEGIDPEKAFLDKMRQLRIDDEILFFKQKKTAALVAHHQNAKEFRKIFADASRNDRLNDLAKKHGYTLIKFVENIENVIDRSLLVLADDTLKKKARDDFKSYFDGDEESNKIDFLILKEFFLRTKEVNSILRKEWEGLTRGIVVFKLHEEGKRFYSDMDTILQSSDSICKKTDRFLRFLAAVLSIPDDEINILDKEIFNKIIFHEQFSYRYEGLFAQFGDAVRPPMAPADPSPVRIKEPPVQSAEDIDLTFLKEELPDAEADLAAEAGDSRSAADLALASKFHIRGTRSWNTREPYIIRMSAEKLKQDYEDLGHAIFFIDSKIDQNTIEKNLKRALMRYLKDRSHSLAEEYREFIFKTLEQQLKGVCRYFGYIDERSNLFMYHLGPFNGYKLVISRFQNDKFGYCCKMLDGKRMKKFFPYEFIKESVLEWYEWNVNSASLPFDRIKEFDEIRTTVSKKYYAELDRINPIIDKLPRTEDPKHPEPNKYHAFRNRWDTWFGLSNILVFKRFIDSTVF